MSKIQFNIEYPEGFLKTNDVILKVQSYGGKNIFKIECDRQVKRKLEKEIKDMLKS